MLLPKAGYAIFYLYYITTMNRYLLIIAIIVASLPAAAQSRCDTFHVYFLLNNSALNSTAKEDLSSLHAGGALTAKDTLIIMGYADMTGADGHNDSLSEMRAQHVKEYLLRNGLSGATYKLCTGRGAVKRSVPTPPGGFPEDRRVDIIAHSGILTKDDMPAPGVHEPFSTGKFARAKKGAVFTLDKIYFFTGRHTVKETSYAQMDELYNAMLKAPNLKVRLEGHVCCVPPAHDAIDEDIPAMAYYASDNLDKSTFAANKDSKVYRYQLKHKDGTVTEGAMNEDANPYHLPRYALSKNRAWQVYKYLLDKGIDADRLTYKGFGGSVRAVPDSSYDSSIKNMRVEIRIVEE